MLGLGKRTFTVLLMTVAVLAASAAVVYAGNRGGDHPKGGAKQHGKHHRHHGHKAGFPPSVTRFDLSGYVLQTKYTLGRNTGNTFEQTYTADSVQGVPTDADVRGIITKEHVADSVADNIKDYA